jgi:hypothetical protein
MHDADTGIPHFDWCPKPRAFEPTTPPRSASAPLAETEHDQRLVRLRERHAIAETHGDVAVRAVKGVGTRNGSDSRSYCLRLLLLRRRQRLLRRQLSERDRELPV